MVGEVEGRGPSPAGHRDPCPGRRARRGSRRPGNRFAVQLALPGAALPAAVHMSSTVTIKETETVPLCFTFTEEENEAARPR